MMTTTIRRSLSPPRWLHTQSSVLIVFFVKSLTATILGTVDAWTPRVSNVIWTFLSRLHGRWRGGQAPSDRLSARTLSSPSTDFAKLRKNAGATEAPRRQSLTSQRENTICAKAEPVIIDSITFRLFSYLSSHCLSFNYFTWLFLLMRSQYGVCTPLSLGALGLIRLKQTLNLTRTWPNFQLGSSSQIKRLFFLSVMKVTAWMCQMEKSWEVTEQSPACFQWIILVTAKCTPEQIESFLAICQTRLQSALGNIPQKRGIEHATS